MQCRPSGAFPVPMAHRLAMATCVLVACGPSTEPVDPLGPAVAVTVTADTVVLATVGASVPLAATATDADGRALPDTALEWTSDNPDVAAVSAEGVVTAVAPGVTHVRITAGQAGTRVFVLSAADAFVIAAPASARQGEVIDLGFGPPAGLSKVVDSLASLVRWAVPDGNGFVDPLTGASVGYEDPLVVVAGIAGLLQDTAVIGVTPRGLSGSFAQLGLGARTSPPTNTDFWIHGPAAYSGTGASFSCVGTSCTCTGPCGDRLVVWSVVDPQSPSKVDSVSHVAGKINDVKVNAAGSIAVATLEGGGRGVLILDLTDPLQPSLLASYEGGLERGVHNVWIEEIGGTEYLFAAEDGTGQDAGLHIIDLTTPDAPVEVSRFYAGSSFVHDVYVRDGLAFVAHWDAGLVILDVGNGVRGGSPAAPVEVSRWVAPRGHVHNAWYAPGAQLVAVGIERFVASGEPPDSAGKVRILDVSDLAAPIEVATYTVPGVTPHNFWMDEARDILFVGWYQAGVRAIDLSGTLRGALERQGRLWAAFLPDGPGGAGSVWAPQLHQGRIYAVDQVNGIWVLDFQTGTP